MRYKFYIVSRRLTSFKASIRALFLEKTRIHPMFFCHVIYHASITRYHQSRTTTAEELNPHKHEHQFQEHTIDRLLIIYQQTNNAFIQMIGFDTMMKSELRKETFIELIKERIQQSWFI